MLWAFCVRDARVSGSTGGISVDASVCRIFLLVACKIWDTFSIAL